MGREALALGWAGAAILVLQTLAAAEGPAPLLPCEAVNSLFQRPLQTHLLCVILPIAYCKVVLVSVLL